MKDIPRFFAALLLAAVSCVTVNLYSPSERVRSADDRFGDAAWERASFPPEAPKTAGRYGIRLDWLAVREAWADQDVDVSTPRIEAIRASLTLRARKLIPLLDSGHLGVDRQGMLAIRTLEGLTLEQRAGLLHLVEADNEDRRELYEEIARANGFPGKAEEVRDIFAEAWRRKADPGCTFRTTRDFGITKGRQANRRQPGPSATWTHDPGIRKGRSTWYDG